MLAVIKLGFQTTNAVKFLFAKYNYSNWLREKNWNREGKRGGEKESVGREGKNRKKIGERKWKDGEKIEKEKSSNKRGSEREREIDI